MAADDDIETRRREKYRGHRISVEAIESKTGRWYWTYLIDGRIGGQGRTLLDSVEAALRQGMNAAECRADGLG